MPPVHLDLSRCSVCAADDVDAPHSRPVVLSDMLPIRHFVEAVVDSDYLPRIAGGNATWILELDGPIAVIAQQWSHSKFLIDPETPIRSVLAGRKQASAHLRYHSQSDPDAEFESLRKAEQEKGM